MRALVFLFLLASSLPAQYFEFAVTDDGRLYFSTPLATAGENSRFKVYRIANDRPELFATGTNDDNPFGTTASAPLVSGDGAITGWALTYPCASPSCGLSGIPRTFFQLQGAGIDPVTAISLQISRNGRYLAGAFFDGHVRLIELPSQRATDLGQSIGLAGPQAVADTGAVLVADAKSLSVRAPGGETRSVDGSEGAVSGALSPAGDLIAFERVRDGSLDLVVNSSVIASTPAGVFRFQPRFANDGTLLYLDPDGQPMLLPPSGAPRRLATIEGGVERAILSGDGRIAWLATRSGQLLRLHTADATVDEVIPATPFLAAGSAFGFPGSDISFRGSGVTPATRFQIGGADLPLAAIGDDVVYVQIPWEYPAASAARPLTVQAPGSPFFQSFDFTSLDRPAIWFERDGQILKAAHQDFRGLVTSADPARPGETLHVYARNMGPVDQTVATGEPSPDPPARVTTPMACYLFDASTDPPWRATGLVVPFAGLSPGAIGVYHIDVTIPAEWTAKKSALQCQMDSGGDIFHGDLSPLDVGRQP